MKAKVNLGIKNLDDVGYTIEDHKGTVLKHHEGKGRFSFKGKAKALAKAKK